MAASQTGSSTAKCIFYHPPHALVEDNQKLYNHVQNVIDECFAKYPSALFCVVGDFNPNSTNVSPAIFKRMCGLRQIVKVQTRDTGTLDWFLTNSPKAFPDPLQLPKIGTSDHYSLLIYQDLKSVGRASKITTIRRDTRDSKLRGFGQWITSFSWQHLFSTESCTEKFAIFKDTMQDALDRYLPKKSFRLHSTDKPWITPKIKSWIAKRQRFLAKFGKNSSLFRLWRNKVSSAIATCKRSFYVAKVKNLKNTNTSQWWREVKNLSGISGNSGQWYRQLIDGQIIDSVDKLCLNINEFFAGLTSSFTPSFTPLDFV